MRTWLYVLVPAALTAYLLAYPDEVIRLMSWLGGLSD
jgi:hypothetical protein